MPSGIIITYLISRSVVRSGFLDIYPADELPVPMDKKASFRLRDLPGATWLASRT
jgi:hypothetical protein